MEKCYDVNTNKNWEEASNYPRVPLYSHEWPWSTLTRATISVGFVLIFLRCVCYYSDSSSLIPLFQRVDQGQSGKITGNCFPGAFEEIKGKHRRKREKARNDM